MSVKTRVNDNLASKNLITDSSESLILDYDNSLNHDEGNPSVGGELTSAMSVDDNEPRGHTAEQSGVMNPEHTGQQSAVPGHTRVESPSNVITDQLQIEKEFLACPSTTTF
ncbi:hypothetical protein ACJMK2_037671 [Sinanodonta woodiana]|uniref:Uncharacterized protein n=1 Tax=Sinanodonta woodiana TaxID=1069815 RepID=A0ABD3WMI4_SINWO